MNLPSEFDPARYIASNQELIKQLSYDLEAAKQHYLEKGNKQGFFIDIFDAQGYLNLNPGLKQQVGDNLAAATRHYITNGYNEGRFWTENETVINQILKQTPNHIGALSQKAKNAAKAKKWELAVEYWEQVISKYPGNIPAYKGKGDALIELEKFAEAETIFQELINKYPKRMVGYESLVRAAMRSQQWEIAIERWETIIEKFSDNIQGYVGKGNALLQLEKLAEAEIVFEEVIEKFPDKSTGYENLINLLIKSKSFDKAETVLKQAKLRFPDNLKLILSEVNLAKTQYKYQEVVKLLEAATTKFPENYNLKINLANSYIQCGDFNNAGEILLGLRNATNKINNSQYLRIFTKTMSNLGKWEEVINYIKEILNPQQVNIDLLYLYISTLMDANLYDEAEKLIIYLLKLVKQLDYSKIYKKELLCVYFLEKIKSIQIISRCQNYIQFAATCDTIVKDIWKIIDNKLNKYQEHDECDFALVKLYQKVYLDNLANKSKQVLTDSKFSPFHAYELAIQIIYHIENKIPFSLIRLGDGEGNFLDYNQEYKDYETIDREATQKIWWGKTPINSKIWQQMEADYLLAIKNADCLGIPELFRLLKMAEKEKEKSIKSSRGSRGVCSIIEHLDEFNLQNKIITSAYIHQDLEGWDLYKLIFRYIDSCSVISCHQKLIPFLREQYNVEVRNFYQISTEINHQVKFGYEINEPHFPDIYHKLCSEIKVAYPGEVFLVAAGFLGKFYCKIIKDKGGIALDVGSVVDYWLGYITRTYGKQKYTSIGMFNQVLKTDKRLEKVNNKTWKKGGIYKSSNDCNYNIYQPKDLLSEWGLTQHKILLITGHSRCGSGFLSYLFRELGVDIGHEKMGKDGVCSWLFTVKDLYIPWEDKKTSYYVKFKYLIHYVRNPLDAIPSIVMENELHERAYNYKRNHILRELNWDIDEYENAIDKAIASYLGWNKLVELQCPHQVLKVENAVEEAVNFLQENSIITIDEERVKNIVIDNKINNSEQKYRKAKPQFTAEDWGKISLELREYLIKFCQAYNYDIEFLEKS